MREFKINQCRLYILTLEYHINKNLNNSMRFLSDEQFFLN